MVGKLGVEDEDGSHPGSVIAPRGVDGGLLHLAHPEAGIVTDETSRARPGTQPGNGQAHFTEGPPTSTPSLKRPVVSSCTGSANSPHL